MILWSTKPKVTRNFIFCSFFQEKTQYEECKDSLNADRNAFTMSKLCNTIKPQTCVDYKSSGEHFIVQESFQ